MSSLWEVVCQDFKPFPSRVWPVKMYTVRTGIAWNHWAVKSRQASAGEVDTQARWLTWKGECVSSWKELCTKRIATWATLTVKVYFFLSTHGNSIKKMFSSSLSTTCKIHDGLNIKVLHYSFDLESLLVNRINFTVIFFLIKWNTEHWTHQFFFFFL